MVCQNNLIKNISFSVIEIVSVIDEFIVFYHTKQFDYRLLPKKRKIVKQIKYIFINHVTIHFTRIRELVDVFNNLKKKRYFIIHTNTNVVELRKIKLSN